MSVYTISKCFFSDRLEKKYISDLLNLFAASTNPFKVAVDKTKRVIDIYEVCAKYDQFIAYWLSLMSYQTSSFEVINVSVSSDIDDYEVFLCVCSRTKSKKDLIVFSCETSPLMEKFEGEGEGEYKVYDGIRIRVLDRDDALCELNSYYGKGERYTFEKCVIASDGSANAKINIK